MKVFNIICQVIIYASLSFSLVMFIYYKFRQHKDKKDTLAKMQQEEIDKEINDEERQDDKKEQ